MPKVRANRGHSKLCEAIQAAILAAKHAPEGKGKRGEHEDQKVLADIEAEPGLVWR